MKNQGQKLILKNKTYAVVFCCCTPSLCCLLITFLFFYGCFPQKVKNNSEIWSGKVFISKKQILNVDVLIKPGTQIILGKGGEVLFRGRVMAMGTADKPIFFTSIKKLPSSWKEINIIHSQQAVFENCVFEYATWGLHVHFSNTLIRNCLFKSNYGGIRFRSGPVKIKGNTFKNNHFAIRLNKSSPVITENTFTNNGTGIFFRDGVKKVYIKNNNFLKPANYHVQMGEEQKHDILMGENWWGSTEYKKIEQFIFDKSRSKYIGKVIFIPMLSRAFPVVRKEK